MTQRYSSVWLAPALFTTLVVFASASACQASPQREKAPIEPPVEQQSSATPARAPIMTGMEVLLRDSAQLIRGKRVGLITNQTAVTSSGVHAADLLYNAPGVTLVALYGPEHGVRGTVEGGVTVDTDRDPKTGVPVYSLYGKTQRPTPEMLRGVDVLLFDIQDIGARPYTFVWTMAMAMEEAAKEHIPFVVLDRPNPITGHTAGPLMQMEMRNVGQPITGYYPVPLRHGMTVGEIAKYINGEYGVGADLHVIPAAGWHYDMWFDETGLPWINPSPNIRSLDAALSYSGMVLFEATNLSVGRGTERPFSYVGAPWLDTPGLLDALKQFDLPGVTLDSVTIVPSGEGYVPFRGENVRALKITITDRDAYEPVWTALVLLSEIKKLQPDQFKITDDGFTQMLGSRWAREAFDRGDAPLSIWKRWQTELAQWKTVRDKYRLYE